MKIWHSNCECPEMYRELVFFLKSSQRCVGRFARIYDSSDELAEPKFQLAHYKAACSFEPEEVEKWAYIDDLVKATELLEAKKPLPTNDFVTVEV